MHKFWTMPTANMMYTKSQNDTNIVVGKHGIKIFEVVVVVLLLLLFWFDVSFFTSAHPLLFFGQVVYPNILKCLL